MIGLTVSVAGRDVIGRHDAIFGPSLMALILRACICRHQNGTAQHFSRRPSFDASIVKHYSKSHLFPASRWSWLIPCT